MSGPPVPDTWPDLAMPGWQVSYVALSVPDRDEWTCRRFGVTWQIIKRDGRWIGRRYKGGQMTAELESDRIPRALHQRLERARRL